MDLETEPEPEPIQELELGDDDIERVDEDENSEDEEEEEDEDEEEEEDDEEEEEEEEESDQDPLESFRPSKELTFHEMLVMSIPKEEALSIPIDIISRDKELCTTWEETMVRWIYDIKDLLSAQESTEMGDWLMPLDEIQFWKSRKNVLDDLLTQIKSTPVRTIQRVMTIIKSPFVEHYEVVTEDVLKAYNESISNLHYLSILIEPFKKLHKSSVDEIADQMRNILWLVRVIWLNSPHYNTRDKLNGLLRKVGSEIIGRCSIEINIDRLFTGHVLSTEAVINKCNECLSLWKTKYLECQKMHNMNSHLAWLLEYDKIMSHVEVFQHRLHDLLEICTCQKLYGRRFEGNQEPLPLYPGLRGPEITRTMQEVERILDENLADLQEASHHILNVQDILSWQECMMKFRNAVKEMETMIEKVLFYTFDGISNLEQGIVVLEQFYVFYPREIITRAYDKLVMKLYKIFEDETNQVRSLYAKNTVPLTQIYSTMAGRGAWALFLKRRLDMQLEVVNKAWWLPECGFGDDVKEQARVLSKTLGEVSVSVFNEWENGVGTVDFSTHLEVPLMTRSTYRVGMIEVNFDKALGKHLAEGEMWAWLGHEIPDTLTNVFFERERLHNLREIVLLVVKDYNRIISSLSLEERQLFRERIKVLDRKIYPGLTKLTWTSDVSDSYIRDCRMAANKVQSYINDYKNANIKIGKLAKKMSNHLMIKVDQKQVYSRTDFNDVQDVYRSKAILKIATYYKNITVILRSVFEMFKTDGAEVKNQWNKYLKKIDKVVEESLCLNMRRSLAMLGLVVHGDIKGPPPPIFKLVILLEGKTIDFEPPVPVLEDMVLGIYRRICITIAAFPRVVQFLNDPSGDVVTSFAQIIARDEACRSTQDHIAEGVKACVAEIEKYLQFWEPYRDVWELDKNVFMQLYEKQNPSLSSYDADIGRYSEVLDAVYGCESEVVVNFCLLDCKYLKDVLSEHCHEWQTRLLTSLFKRGTEKLTEVYNFIDDSVSKFKNKPKTLPDLGNAVTLYRDVRTAGGNLERSFPKVIEHFTILKKYEFDVGPTIKAKLESFHSDWNSFMDQIKDVKQMLKEAKEEMKTVVLNMAEEFKLHVEEFIQSFSSEDWGLYDPETAVHEVVKYRVTFNQLKKDEQDILDSTTFFTTDITAAVADLKKAERQLLRMETLLGVEFEETAAVVEKPEPAKPEKKEKDKPAPPEKKEKSAPPPSQAPSKSRRNK